MFAPSNSLPGTSKSKEAGLNVSANGKIVQLASKFQEWKARRVFDNDGSNNQAATVKPSPLVQNIINHLTPANPARLNTKRSQAKAFLGYLCSASFSVLLHVAKSKPQNRIMWLSDDCLSLCFNQVRVESDDSSILLSSIVAVVKGTGTPGFPRLPNTPSEECFSVCTSNGALHFSVAEPDFSLSQTITKAASRDYFIDAIQFIIQNSSTPALSEVSIPMPAQTAPVAGAGLGSGVGSGVGTGVMSNIIKHRRASADASAAISVHSPSDGPKTAAIFQGRHFIKHAMFSKKNKYFWVSEDGQRLCWGTAKTDSPKKFILISSIKSITPGRLAHAPVLGAPASEEDSFLKINHRKPTLLQIPRVSDVISWDSIRAERDFWVNGLRRMVDPNYGALSRPASVAPPAAPSAASSAPVSSISPSFAENQASLTVPSASASASASSSLTVPAASSSSYSRPPAFMESTYSTR